MKTVLTTMILMMSLSITAHAQVKDELRGTYRSLPSERSVCPRNLVLSIHNNQQGVTDSIDISGDRPDTEYSEMHFGVAPLRHYISSERFVEITYDYKTPNIVKKIERNFQKNFLGQFKPTTRSEDHLVLSRKNDVVVLTILTEINTIGNVSSYPGSCSFSK